jgi:hypothetical protein
MRCSWKRKNVFTFLLIKALIFPDFLDLLSLGVPFLVILAP